MWGWNDKKAVGGGGRRRRGRVYDYHSLNSLTLWYLAAHFIV